MHGRWSLAAAFLLVLVLCLPVLAAIPGSGKLTSAQILALGLDGYVEYCEQQQEKRYRKFSDAQLLAAWSKYAECRKQLNQKEARRLSEASRRLFRRAESALSAWQQSYLEVVRVATGYGKPPELLRRWPEPRREDVYGDILAVLKDSQILKPALTSHSAAALNSAEAWADVCLRMHAQRRELGFLRPEDRDTDLSSSAAELREDATELEAVVRELPAQAQWFLCRHVILFTIEAIPMVARR